MLHCVPSHTFPPSSLAPMPKGQWLYPRRCSQLARVEERLRPGWAARRDPGLWGRNSLGRKGRGETEAGDMWVESGEGEKGRWTGQKENRGVGVVGEEDGGVWMLLPLGVGLKDGSGLVAVCHEWHWRGVLLLVEPSCCFKDLLSTGDSAAHPTVPESGVLVKPQLFCTSGDARAAPWLQ